MKTKPNEPISPTVIKVKINYKDKTAAALLPEFENKTVLGLTKREYFAAMAMQGFMAAINNATKDMCKTIAMIAVKQADTLINELNKSQS